MDQLYLSTLDMLAGSPVAELRPPAAEDPAQGEDGLAATADLAVCQQDVAMMRQRREEAVALLASSPEIYAVELSKRLTGAPILSEGYPNPLFDLIIQVCIRATHRRWSPCIPPCSQAHPAALPLGYLHLQAVPPAALTVEGIRRAHAEAAELAVDLKGRKKRSVASIIGRAKLTAEQADRLKAGTAAARILDMLLALPTQAERLSCLPDCFTPPDPDDAGPEAEEAGTSGEVEDVADEEGASEALWCTAPQMLSELEVRIRSISPAGQQVSSTKAVAMLSAEGDARLSGPELLSVMEGLRADIKQTWLTNMGVP